MSNPLVRKLENFVRLSPEEKQALEKIAQPARRLGAREDVIRDGERPRHVHVVLEGWACRYKQLEDGRRQVISIFLPGDLCDPHVFVLRKMDHSLGTLTPVVLAEISESAIREIAVQFPRVAEALWWEVLVTAAIHREWLVNVGRRTALERVAHLLCEVYFRQAAVGRAKEGRCELPITQVELADALGLSAVHVNRTLRELRLSGLIDWRGKTLAIPDVDALTRIARFSPDYLHLDFEGEQFDAAC